MPAFAPIFDRSSTDKQASLTVKRARRFSVQVALRYRVRAEKRWRSGVTKNIGMSGILFLAEQVEEPSTHIEMRLALPMELSGEPGAELICQGRVVRAVQPNGESLPALASTISHYRFVRP
jgi:hypothetical protein